MEIDRDAARMLCVGLPGTAADARVLGLIDRGVGAVIFFKRNVNSPQQFAALTASLKRHVNRPLLTCIDHEGGRVVRLTRGFTPIPAMRQLGATGDVSLAEQVGEIVGRELRAVNIDWNFAPVLDVDTNPKNPVIGDRSFGTTSAVVSNMAGAFVAGMQHAGVGACGKHFPGHGDTHLDSHYALPTVDHSLERLRTIEFPPFKSAARNGIASMMTAHVVVTAIDPERPATLSRPVMDLLRAECAFDGVVVSDDLEMKAIADHFGVEKAAVMAVNAGVDMVCVCHDQDLQERTIKALARAIETGEVSRERVTEAHRRIDKLTSQFARAPVDESLLRICSSEQHRAVMDRIGAELAVSADPTDYRK